MTKKEKSKLIDTLVDNYVGLYALSQLAFDCEITDEDREACKNLTAEQILQLMRHSFTVGGLIGEMSGEVSNDEILNVKVFKEKANLFAVHMKAFHAAIAKILPMKFKQPQIL